MSLPLFTPGSIGIHTSDGRHHYEAWHGNARHARRLENFVIHPPYELLRYASSTRLCKWRLSTFDVRLPKPLSVVCLVYYSALMLGTDHRGTPSRRGVVSSRLGYAHRPRGLLRHEARPRAAKKNHLQLGGRRFLVALAAAFIQARRQDIVDGSSRLHSTCGPWYGHRMQRASSIGETEINV